MSAWKLLDIENIRDVEIALILNSENAAALELCNVSLYITVIKLDIKGRVHLSRGGKAGGVSRGPFVAQDLVSQFFKQINE